MFVEAIKKLSFSTHAFIESVKFHDPKSPALTVACTFIVLNEDGWVLTASHVLNTYKKAQTDLAAMAAYKEAERKISSTPRMTPKQKNDVLRPLISNIQHPDTIIAHTWMTSFGLEKGPDTIEFTAINETADIALGRISNFDKNSVTEYPVFHNPERPIEIGTPICRLGFPFTDAPTTFDSQTGKFTVPNITLSRFPNDGIVTRFLHQPCPLISSLTPVTWLETSTPGIKGQSGGPIFNAFGHFCAIQSHTQTLSLDFNVPHQYLSVGRGTYVGEIVALMRSQNVKFQLAN
jgi:hypothetical protein